MQEALKQGWYCYTVTWTVTVKKRSIVEWIFGVPKYQVKIVITEEVG